jgi:hypothetical protein
VTYPRVRKVITAQGTDLAPILNREADRVQCPPRLLTALCVMESNLDEASRRPTDPADDFAYWPDVSGSLTHQAVAFAPIGDRQPTRANIDYVLGYLMAHPADAIRIAADNIGPKWAQWQDGLEALSRYNAPGLRWHQNPNRENIHRGWNTAATYVVPETEADMADFVGGFAELAEALGADVVGEPLADEYQSGPTTRQPTTTGEMIWTDGGPALFLVGIAAQ